MAGLLPSLARAAALLAGNHDENVRKIGAWLAAGAPGDLWEHLGRPNAPGFSARHTEALRERDRIIGTLDVSPTTLARELRHYFDRQWLRTEDGATCPHPEGSHEAAYWQILKCSRRPLSLRTIQEVRARSVQGEPRGRRAIVGGDR